MILLKQMVVLFLIMMIGALCRKLGLLNDESSKKISGLVVNVANPALILSAGINQKSSLRGRQLLVTVCLAVGIYLSLIILSIIVTKILRADKKDAGLYRVMFIFSNIGFMGFPLIRAAYGSEALLSASIFLIPYNVLIYTMGISEMTDERDGSRNAAKKMSVKDYLRKIFNIGVIACILSIFLYMTKVHVPDVIENTITILSGLTAPLSMMIIGDSMTKIDFRKMFKDYRLFVFAVIKLLIIPIAGVFILKASGFNGMLLEVCLIMLSTPVGSMTVMLAAQYDGDYELASKGVALTTVLSVVTIPVVSFITGV